MGIRIVHMPNIPAKKAKFASEVDEEMRSLGPDTIEEIRTRSQRKGVDAEGRAFKPYSPKYQKFKAKRTKTSSPRPNLTLSGHMMKGLQWMFFRRGALRVTRVYPIANETASKIKGNNKTRNFFAISKEQVQAFKERLTNIRRKLK